MRVLVVDNDAASREALEQALCQAIPTPELLVCISAEDVKALKEPACFDVAFLDPAFPGIDGIDFVRGLRKANPKLNVIFVADGNDHMAEAFALHSSGYLLRPVCVERVTDELADLRYPMPRRDRYPGLFMRCFGNFEVFDAGQQLLFQRAKTKELLAYLVDRRGALVSIHEVDAALWEDAPHGASISGSYLRTLVSDLKQTLEEAGHPKVLVKRYGELGSDTSKSGCDYYDYLRGDARAFRDWHGEYMSQYSWAERTRAILMQ